MRDILDYAGYIVKKYEKVYHQPIDEMKLHKLLFYLQKYSLALYHQPAYQEELVAWVHGPVSLTVRENFNSLKYHRETLNKLERNLTDFIIEKYGVLSSWTLREMSHQEKSWQDARKGLQDKEIGTNLITMDSIKQDLTHFKVFDSNWGCFIEEFDDYDW